MSKQLKVILLVLAGLMIVIQFIPSNLPDNEPTAGYDFFTMHEVPDEIEELIRASCYDCHSQEVTYPWYSYVAPVSWLVSRDVKVGRANLDFSKWETLSKKDQIVLAEEIGEEVMMGTMPMPIYGIMHREARLDTAQRQQIETWSGELAERIFEK
jgi:hypothetical protein